MQRIQINDCQELGLKLIFVGPDCGGKSTLAEQVGVHFGLPVNAHRRIDDEEMRVTVAEDALTAVKSQYSHWIRDQYYYPVDILYSAAMRSEQSILSPMEMALANAYRLAGVIFVFVTASPEELGRRFYERGDELWDLAQIQRVARLYEDWYSWARHTHHLVRIDTTQMSRDEMVKEAIAGIGKKYKEIAGGKFDVGF